MNIIATQVRPSTSSCMPTPFKPSQAKCPDGHTRISFLCRRQTLTKAEFIEGGTVGEGVVRSQVNWGACEENRMRAVI